MDYIPQSRKVVPLAKALPPAHPGRRELRAGGVLPIEGLLGLAGRLANPNFAGKAPPEVVAECQANLAEAEAQAEMLRGRLGELG